MTRNYLGVDPGVGGGLALVNSVGVLLATARMPATDRDILDLLEEWLDSYCIGNSVNLHAYLESIAPGFPGTGKSAMAKLYGSYRALRMALASWLITTEEVRSVVWQRNLGLGGKGAAGTTIWKNRLKARAQQLFPLSRDITLHTADAVLLAEYGRRQKEDRSAPDTPKQKKSSLNTVPSRVPLSGG